MTQVFLLPSPVPGNHPSTFCYFLIAINGSRRKPHFPDKSDKSPRIVPPEWPGIGQHPPNKWPESQGWVVAQEVLTAEGAYTPGKQNQQSHTMNRGRARMWESSPHQPSHPPPCSPSPPAPPLPHTLPPPYTPFITPPTQFRTYSYLHYLSSKQVYLNSPTDFKKSL